MLVRALEAGAFEALQASGVRWQANRDQLLATLSPEAMAAGDVVSAKAYLAMYNKGRDDATAYDKALAAS